jgi:Flp pilus assembly protein TadB
MSASNSVRDPVLERQGRRMIGPAVRFIATAALLAVAGVILIVTGSSLVIGIALVLLASCPAFVGFGLLTGGTVARWAGRHKLFA